MIKIDMIDVKTGFCGIKITKALLNRAGNKMKLFEILEEEGIGSGIHVIGVDQSTIFAENLSDIQAAKLAHRFLTELLVDDIQFTYDVLLFKIFLPQKDIGTLLSISEALAEQKIKIEFIKQDGVHSPLYLGIKSEKSEEVKTLIKSRLGMDI